MDITQAVDATEKIAAKHAFEYAGNFGRGTFTHKVTVVSNSDDSLVLQSACNACVSEKLAQEQLAKVHAEFAEWCRANGMSKTVCVKSRGFYVTRYGFWHMGRFDTSGFTRAYRLRVDAEMQAAV